MRLRAHAAAMEGNARFLGSVMVEVQKLVVWILLLR